MTVTSVQDTDMGRCLVDIRGDCYLQDRHGPRAGWPTTGVTVTQDTHGLRAWWPTSGVTVIYRTPTESVMAV